MLLRSKSSASLNAYGFWPEAKAMLHRFQLVRPAAGRGSLAYQRSGAKQSGDRTLRLPLPV
jgi:hypothetical protein